MDFAHMLIYNQKKYYGLKMIIIDYSQTVISNIMAELNIAKEKKLEVNLIRHMVLNTIRSYVTSYHVIYYYYAI